MIKRVWELNRNRWCRGVNCFSVEGNICKSKPVTFTISHKFFHFFLLCEIKYIEYFFSNFLQIKTNTQFMMLPFSSLYHKQHLKCIGGSIHLRLLLQELDQRMEWLNEVSGLMLQVERNGSPLSNRWEMWHHPAGVYGSGGACYFRLPSSDLSVRQIEIWAWSINHPKAGEFRKVT